MIFSKLTNQYKPVTVPPPKRHNLGEFGIFTSYTVKDDKITVGKVDLLDTAKGVKVMYIENCQPQLYKGFGKIADQIEVEHCLKRGLDTFEITSDAGLNSHAVHYLRGKRFVKKIYNQIVEQIINSTPQGEQYNTKKLGNIEMYMPQKLIKKYLEIIKKNPLLK